MSMNSGGEHHTSDSDVIILGAGHNGLVAACYLAKAGLKVTVVEASPTVGGMTCTNASIPEAPNHLINEGAIQASLFRATTIESDLELGRYGFRQIPVDVHHVHLDPDGASLAVWTDPRRTADELRYFSRRDAASWLELAEELDALIDLAVPYMLSHPTRPSPRLAVSLLRNVACHRGKLGSVADFFLRSHAEMIEERFESPLLRGALAQMPCFSWMTQQSTGWALIYIALCQRTRSSRFVGGTGALATALEACLSDHGGRVRLSAKVDQLTVSGGAVTGVRLTSGEELTSRVVLASCSPKTTLTRLLPAGLLPDRLAARAERIPTTLTEAASLRIDVALSGQLRLPRHNAWRKDGLDLRYPIVCWQTYEDHLAAWDAVVGRRWPDPIPFIALAPTAADPTQAPEGQDTFWLWSGIVPVHPLEPWAKMRDVIGEKILAECAKYYEGIDSLEIGRKVYSAPELEERFHAIDGNVYHVDPLAQRFGPLRPAIGLGSYETPVPGLFLTGAGTHPTGGICGIPGQLAAQAVVRKLKRGDAPRRAATLTSSLDRDVVDVRWS